jgi:putative ABC transport system permease protein
MQDIRYAFRLLIKSPTFTIVALTTLAVGIAANAAIFSVVNALLLRPLPYPEPDRLVMLWQDLRARGGPDDESLAPAHFFDWSSRSRSFEATTVFRGSSPSLTGDGEPEQLRGWQVSGRFFRVLGVAPMLGRDFRPEDDQPGAQPVAILSHGLWTRRFGADGGMIGRSISLNREPHVVIGVLPPDFRAPFFAPEIFRPLRLNPARASRGNIELQMIARLRPGVPLERAQAEMSAVGNALAQEYPETDKGSTIRITQLHDEVTGDVRTPLMALLGAVLLVLLIACANIASLLLARASVRAREMAVRTALGAARTRIVRQLLTESVLLGVAGGVAGLLLSSWLLDALLSFAPPGTARLDQVRIDGGVLAFGIALALITSVGFGIVPALLAARGDVVSTLKEGGIRGGSGSRDGLFARSAFVVAELALALMLLVGAGLLMRSLVNLKAVDPGFEPENLLATLVALPPNGYPEADHVRTFYTSLLERLHTASGVERAAIVSVMPFSGDDTDTGFQIVGRPAPRDPADRPVAWYRVVSPDYFRTVGVRLEAGRFLQAIDVNGVEEVAVINRTLANRHWPGENPIGARIATANRTFTIVGIAGDVHHRNLRDDPRSELYLAHAQAPGRQMYIVVKATGDPAALTPVLRQQVAAIDSNIPLSRVATMETLMADSLALPRMIATLMGAFAAAALLLAAVGIYGLMAYSVAQRTQEFGIRMALGAASGDVVRLVLGHAARLAVIGVAAGALVAAAAARSIGTLLFGVSAGDAPTFAATALLLAAIAMLASYLPARRAVRVDPVTALRAE